MKKIKSFVTLKSAFVLACFLTIIGLVIGFIIHPHIGESLAHASKWFWLGAGAIPLLGTVDNHFQETPCKVVISNNFDTHGTITRSSVEHLTPSQLIDLFKPGGKFADMTDWFRTSFEMKACGTRTNGIYDWLMSSARNVGPSGANLLNYEKLDRGGSLLKPFIMGRQDSVINKDFWAITNGWANSAYTEAVTGPLTTADKALGSASDRVIRVVTRYGMDLDSKWFLGRDRVFIMGMSGGTSTRGVWKVLASEVSSDLSYIDVLITSENAGSVSVYDTAPNCGVLLAMGNNVNDFESWCSNRPTVDPRKRVPFWYQTMRRTRAVDSEYKLVFAKLMESNEYFRNFGDLPLAERNRQDEEEFQKRWVNSFFFGKPISANQTMALYQNLETIQTVTGSTINTGLGGQVVAYRANMVGVYEQLKACSRVRDLQNNTLNFYEWLDENYRIYRARKSMGKPTDSIDWFTDSNYAAQLESAFIAYYKKEYGDILRINLDITEGQNAELGFSWRTFKVKFPTGVKINIITHEFFDDMVNAATAENLGSTGRFLMCLDMGKPGPKGGTIYPGMIASNKKMRTLGELENLARIDPTYTCTMETITEEISLVSETTTAIVECPAVSLIIEGIGDAVPVTTGKSGDWSNFYSDLY